MSALSDKLTSLGFTDDAKAKQAAEDNAQAQDLSANGEYIVEGVFTKDDVVVTVEQNQAPEDLGGLTAVVTHPPVAVIASPKGRIAFNPEDAELAETLVTQLS
jgi:hypothetical protein